MRNDAGELTQCEEQYRLLVEGAREYAVFSINTTYFITSWNPGAERVLGYTDSEITGQHASRIFTPEDVASGETQREFERAMAHGKSVDERWHVRKDGTRFWASGQLLALRDETGASRGYCKLLRDMTQEKQASEALLKSEERFRLLVEEIVDYGVFMLDPNGYVVSWNRGAQRFNGYEPAEIVGKHFSTFYSKEDIRAGIPEKELKAAREQGHLRSEGWRFGKGVRFWGEETITPIHDTQGTLLGFSKIIRDVTERLQAEEERFELLLRERAARQEAETANRAKGEFLATLAHELRNPLAPIRNAVELQKAQTDGSPILHRSREIIERQVNHLVRMIDDLLDITRIERGKVELRKQPLDLSSVIHNAVEACNHLIAERGHQLSLSLPAEPLVVDADPTRIEQVVANLLNNAAKYTTRNGRIWISAAAEKNDAVIRVRDNGIGISPEMIGRVFDMFAQADQSLERTYGGLGIGLTLVRSLVQMHGGNTIAESDGIGKGSQFTVRLPAMLRKMPKTEDSAPKESLEATLRVLVVEDNPDSRESMVALLGMWGHQVEAAETGPEGLEKAIEFHPDIAFIDLGLPGIDGFELARRIRQSLGHNPFLVVLSGYGQRGDLQKSTAAGFNKHLLKPADAAAVRDMLVQSARRRSGRRAEPCRS